MVQIGILGNLLFDETTYGWNLDLGDLIAKYEFLQDLNRLTEQTNPGIEKVRRLTVQAINKSLKDHFIRYEVPPIVSGRESEINQIEAVIWYLYAHASPAHVVFTRIAVANHCLEQIDVNVSSSMNEAVRGLAKDQLDCISDRHPDFRLRPEELCECLEKKPKNLRLRKLLQKLQAPLPILFVTASPKDQVQLELVEEQNIFASTVHQVDPTTNRNAFKVVFAKNCRTEELSHHIQDHRPTIIHFSGHGASGNLYFEARDGTTNIVDPRALTRLLKLAVQEGLEGVVMNACYSSEGAGYIAQTVKHVIAMEGIVTDHHAISFTKEFYFSLSKGRSFEEAFKWAVATTGIDPKTSALKPRLIADSFR